MLKKHWLSCPLAISLAWAGIASATQMSEFGWAMHRLRPFISTRALVVAKLIEIRNGPVEAYLAFEVVRVERGELADRYLLFPFPETRFEPLQHDHGDINALKEGSFFLLQIGSRDDPLQHWTLLAGLDDRGPIEKTLKAFAEVDRLRSDDFWKDVNSTDMRVRAGAFLRCAGSSAANRFAVLEQYAAKAEPTEFESELAADLMRNPSLDVDNALLLRIAGRPNTAKNRVQLFRQVQARDQAIERGGMAGGEAWDRAIILALQDEDFVMSSAASVLSRRPVAGSAPQLRTIVERALAKPVNERLAAIAVSMLAHQEGAAALDLVRRVSQSNTDEYNLSWLQAAVITCGEDDAIAVNQTLPPNKRHTHNHNFATLVTRGDPEAIERFLTDSMQANYIRPPHPKDLPNRKALENWRPIARNMIRQDVLADGSAFLHAVEILYWLHDEELPTWLTAQVGHQHWGEYALQFLALTARTEHRPTLEQFREDPNHIKRSYALAGLARLGDESAMRDVCLIAFLGPDSYARHLVTGNVLARIDRTNLIRAWESSAPPSDDVIGSAKHRYVLSKLTEPMRQTYGQEDPDDIRWPVEPQPGRSRMALIVAMGIAILVLLVAVVARLQRRRGRVPRAS
jgi:hypothetical protein